MTEDTTAISVLSEISRLPSEMTQQQANLSIQAILDLPNDTDKYTFNHGDNIKNAYAFNEYLNANIERNSTLTLTKAQILGLIRKLATTLSCGGLDTLPMVCMGNDCIRYCTCPLVATNTTLPVGESCVIEKTELSNHVKRLAKDFEDLPNYADQLMVHGVAACEIIKSRVYADMSATPNAVITVGKGVDKFGNPINDRVDNPNHKIWSSINVTEQKLLKSLHMTLEQRKAASTKSSKRDPDALRAMYRKRLTELKNKNQSELDVIDVVPQSVVTSKGDQDAQVVSGSGSGPAPTVPVTGTDSSVGSRADAGTTGNSTEGPRLVDRAKKVLNKLAPKARGGDGEQDTSESTVSRRVKRTEDTSAGANDSGMEVVL